MSSLVLKNWNTLKFCTTTASRKGFPNLSNDAKIKLGKSLSFD